jgi:hypothetical protein
LNGSYVKSVIETAEGFAVAGSSDSSTNASRVWVMKTNVNGDAPQNFSEAPALGPANSDSLLNTQAVIAIILVAVIGIPLISLLLYRRHRKSPT